MFQVTWVPEQGLGTFVETQNYLLSKKGKILSVYHLVRDCLGCKETDKQDL